MCFFSQCARCERKTRTNVHVNETNEQKTRIIITRTRPSADDSGSKLEGKRASEREIKNVACLLGHSVKTDGCKLVACGRRICLLFDCYHTVCNILGVLTCTEIAWFFLFTFHHISYSYCNGIILLQFFLFGANKRAKQYSRQGKTSIHAIVFSSCFQTQLGSMLRGSSFSRCGAVWVVKFYERWINAFDWILGTVSTHESRKSWICQLPHAVCVCAWHTSILAWL